MIARSHVVHRYGEGLDVDVPIARFADIEADVGDLRIGIGAPRNRQRAQAPVAERQRVMHRDACGRVGGVRELVLEAGIARGVDARIAGPQEVVDPDAGGGVAVDARSLEIEALDVG